MHASLITGRGRIEPREFPEPKLAAGGAIVDVAYCGICGTDVHAFQSGDPYPPGLCGHEWMGRVRDVADDVATFAPGDRVSVGILPPCGACAQCRAGQGAWCYPAMMSLGGGDPRGSAHGAFAPRIAASAARLVRVPDAISDAAAALIEPATVAYHGVRLGRIRLGDFAVVQGAGPIGLFALQWVRHAGAREIVVVEPSPVRAALARSLGATLTCTPSEVAELVQDGTGGLGADAVVECAGRPETIQSAVDLARRGGAVTLIGLSDKDATIRPGIWLMKEVTVRCSIAYEQRDFPPVVEMLADGRVRAEPLHTRTVGLSRLADAMAELAAGGSRDVKVLVDPTN
ncbi:MAG: zinc-binding dehydrogenase [Deltaproteobacteria bacterium]|nr:zinc-binding dehydrogenase [Deltaproteobacteria bacterium]